MIRKAKAADAEAIEKIENSWPTAPGWTRSQIEQEASRPESVFLVEIDNDQLIGHAAFRKEIDEAHLLTLAVRKDRVRNRIGRGLMEALVLEAERLGLSKMTLEVEASNTGALALYKAVRFEEVGRRKAFYGPGRDAVLMDLLL